MIHKWTSLICTAFLLMLCITGLPLIFHEEIDRAIGTRAALPAVPAGTPLLPLDDLVRRAVAMYPAERPLFLSFDEDRPVANVTTAPTARSSPKEMHVTAMDRRTGAAIGELNDNGVMAVILRLHTDMFVDLAGELFLGAMAVLFLIATISGVVLYAPFMRKLRFGTLRRHRRKRVRWLDVHNLLGIVTVAWVVVVGLTGVVNTLSTPLVQIWRDTQLAAITRPYARLPPLPVDRFGSVDAALRAAEQAAAGTRPQYIAFPGTDFSSNHHYAVWLQGATPATSRLVTPALVDARTGKLTAMHRMPWYMQALSLSQPLHFGDYAGLPLKILWALLDICTIFILATGLYLWLTRRSSAVEARIRDGVNGASAVRPVRSA
jgi:uncharacterized iron-regulated membrane protein